MNHYANEAILIQFHSPDLGLLCNEIESEQWDSCCVQMIQRLSGNMFFHTEVEKKKTQKHVSADPYGCICRASGSAQHIQLPIYISSCIRTSRCRVQSEN